ncbi:MAG: hypothetical protein D3910_11810, partial [Candidatus Electrothrix sp. ATG2]|nr:hypothetical protein [Candidatus Electrothrix sp. ATG2]
MTNKLFVVTHVILVSFMLLNFPPISARACSYTIFPERKNFTSTGGDQVVTINSSSEDCKWFTNENLTWVEVSPSSGEGSDIVTIHVISNIDSMIRKGSVNIAGHEFIITQLGVISSESDTGSYSKESMTSMSIITDSTKEDAEGNIYTVMGAAESVTDFNIYADTGIDTEKILGESEEKLTEYFTKLNFSDSANQNLRCDVEIKYDRIPTKIVAWNKESKQYYYLPFTSTYNTIKIRINTKDISILPIYKTLKESSAIFESTGSYINRFNIIENNGTTLQIKTDLDYSNCKLLINGENVGGCNGSSEEYLYNNTVSESGIYTFILENALTINIWEQDVFVQVNSDLDGINIDSLAKKFAPVLAYNDYEEYFPMSLQYIFQNDINENIPFEIPKEGSNDVPVPYSEVDSFMPYNGASTGLINNYDKDSSLQRTRLGNLDNATVYYSMIKGLSGYYYLNYHMLYTFDPKGGTSTEPGTFAHVFDRESMTLVFNSTPKD